MTFYASDEKPLIQYEVSFPKKPLLLGEGSAGRETGDSGGTHVGVTEVLDDRIEWEPHVDKADKLDYIVAASGGVLAGLIDAFYVGEFSLDRATEWGKDKVNRFVIKAARAEGYKGDTLSGAIKALEKNHPFAADGNANDFGGGLQHHLRDFFASLQYQRHIFLYFYPVRWFGCWDRQGRKALHCVRARIAPCIYW